MDPAAMNVVFLSPHFPPHFHLFCAALRRRGGRALGLGDSPSGALAPQVTAALDDYVGVDSLERYEDVYRATALLAARHGRIDHLDSLNEHWLPLEARLRDDFNVPGMRPAAVARGQSKLAMATAFQAAGLPVIEGERLTDAAALRAFVDRVGLPILVKPDVGVGASGARKISTPEELAELSADLPTGAVVQRCIEAPITTFDGLLDRDGHVVFASSFLYAAGVLEFVSEQRDVAYHSRRSIPPALVESGLRAVAALDLRTQFFHAEFFALPDGSYLPLEVNLRPPGGFSTDLFNYTFDFDCYDLWAAMILGQLPAELPTPEARYHCAHASRRDRSYRHGHDELVARLGPLLVHWQDLPPAIAYAMGSPVYLLRHPDESVLLEAIALVHAR